MLTRSWRSCQGNLFRFLVFNFLTCLFIWICHFCLNFTDNSYLRFYVLEFTLHTKLLLQSGQDTTLCQKIWICGLWGWNSVSKKCENNATVPKSVMPKQATPMKADDSLKCKKCRSQFKSQDYFNAHKCLNCTISYS